jgi:hypothetical protein
MVKIAFHSDSLFPSLLIFSLFAHVHGSAWPSRPGHGNATVGYSFLKAKTVSDGQGQKQNYAVQESGFSIFGETDLYPRLAVNWSWGFVKSVNSDSMDNVGTTDPELGLTYYLGHRGHLYISAMVNTRIPLGPENGSNVPKFVYPLFSQQAWAWDIRPLLGWSESGWWFQGSIGPRLRSSGLAPQIGYNLAGGTKLGVNFNSMLAFSGLLPLDNESAGSPADREKYLGFQLAFAYQVHKRWTTGLQFDGMFGASQGMPLALRTNIFGRYAW